MLSDPASVWREKLVLTKFLSAFIIIVDSYHSCNSLMIAVLAKYAVGCCKKLANSITYTQSRSLSVHFICPTLFYHLIYGLFPHELLRVYLFLVFTTLTLDLWD